MGEAVPRANHRGSGSVLGLLRVYKDVSLASAFFSLAAPPDVYFRPAQWRRLEMAGVCWLTKA